MVKSNLMGKLENANQCFMATYLLEEKLKPIDQQWAYAYIDMLPKEFSNFPIFFNDNELKYLKGTQFLEQLKERKA